MLERSLIHKLWLFQYLTPVLIAILYYLLRLAPQDQSFFQVILFLAGTYVGNLILWMDGAFFYPKYNELQTYPQKLMTRSLLFLIAFVALGVFVVTSSGSSLGAGVVIGIGISLFGEMVAYFRSNPQFFQQRFLYQLNRHVSLNELRGIVIIFGVIMLALIGLLISRNY